MSDEKPFPEKDSSWSNIALERKADADKEAASGATGRLPDDFPGKAALSDANVNTYAQLRKVGDPTDLPGIGPATAAKIADALAAADKEATS